MHENLVVALGAQRYRVDRPWGDIWGGRPAGLGRISDVACDAAGRVHVLLRTDPAEHPGTPAVIVLAPDGQRLAAWGEEVLDGHMLTVHPDGRVFVVDRDAHEVIIFSPEGRRIGGLGQRHAPGKPFNAPCDIAFAPDGTMVVADGYGNSLVHRFSPEGRHLGAWGSPGGRDGKFSTPHGVWVLPDGRIAVADRENNRVQIFDPEGSFLQEVTDLHKLMAIHGAPGGGFLVTDQVPRLSQFDAADRLVGRCRPVLNGAHGMWRVGGGEIYLSEQDPNRLTRLVPI